MPNKKGFAAPFLLIILLFILIGVLFLSLYLINNNKISFLNFASQLTANVTGGPTNPNENKIKTVVIIYDPILKTKGNVKLHEYYHWNDPKVLTTQLVNDFKTISHGNASYQIVETLEQDNWLPHQNGQRYTENDYFDVYASKSWNKGAPDWQAFLTENNLTEKINSGKVDEVWLWAAPEGGYEESVMVGNGAFWINGSPVTADTKAVPIMDYNYERGMAEALESYGHRTESIIRRVYGSWNVFAPNAKILHPWDAFTALDQYTPGKGGLGNAHNAFNAEPGTDYNRYSQRSLPTSADDWTNFPDMTGTTTNKNCTAWNCDAYQYLKWWYSHMPYMPGIKDGYLNNWWKYITNVEEYKDTFRFQNVTAVPSHDYTKDPIAQWRCSAVNGICNVSDETQQKLSSGKSIKYTTDSGYDTQTTFSTTEALNIGSQKYLVFSVFAVNTNDQPIFEVNSPTIYLKDRSGNFIKYQPGSSLLDTAVGKWQQFIIPLDGDSIWQKTVSGGISLNDITTIEIHSDTWGYGFTLYFDNLGFTNSLTEIPDTTSPTINITNPTSDALISQTVTATVVATDSSKIGRVDFFIDGSYTDSDTISPFTYDIDPSKIPSGTHTFVARAFDSFGNQNDSQISFASSTTTLSNKPPIANYTASPTTGRSPLAVSFTNLSTDQESSFLRYLWSFGLNYQFGKSIQKDPVQTFVVNRYKQTDPKTVSVSVKLTVTDSGRKTDSIAKQITVIANNTPTASFTYANKKTLNGNRTSFFSTVSDLDNDPVTILWNFGDGTTSNLNNPIHLYTAKGKYKVTLTVTDDHEGKRTVAKPLSF